MSPGVPEPDPITSLKTAALFAGEAVVPGGSNLVKGHLADGILYAAIGGFARAVLGFPWSALVSASSFTKATTDHHLPEVVRSIPLGGGADRETVEQLRTKVAELEAKINALSAT